MTDDRFDEVWHAFRCYDCDPDNKSASTSRTCCCFPAASGRRTTARAAGVSEPQRDRAAGQRDPDAVAGTGRRSGDAMTDATAGRNKRSRPVGYAPWDPAPRRASARADHAVLDDHADYWPITPRQVLYRLMGRGQAESRRRAHRRLHRPRAPRRLDSVGGDRRRSHRVGGPGVCDDPEAFLAEMRDSASVYQLDRQEDQAVYIELVVEAAGAIDSLPDRRRHGVPVYSGSGSSVTRYGRCAARRVARHADRRSWSPGTSTRRAGTFARVWPRVAAFAEDHDVPGSRSDDRARRRPGRPSSRCEGADDRQEAREVPVVAPRLDGRLEARVAGGPRRARRRRRSKTSRTRIPGRP